MNIDSFLYNILPICIVLFGLFGNLICFVVFSRRKFKRISLNFLLRVMTITDSISLLQILPTYFKYSRFNFDIGTVSAFSCKTFLYFKYFICPVKGWILVIIAFERYLSVQYPRRSFIFKRKHFQYSILTFIFLFNMSYNLPYAINLDIKSFYNANEAKKALLQLFDDRDNITNRTLTTTNYTTFTEHMDTDIFYECRFANPLTAHIVLYMHIVNTATLPFGLMLLSTILVLISLYNSKNRMLKYNFQTARRRSYVTARDVRFSFTSIMLNILFLVFNLPLAVSYFTSYDFSKPDPFRTRTFAIVTDIYFSSFATPLLIYLASNTIFCQEFLAMVKGLCGKDGVVKVFSS